MTVIYNFIIREVFRQLEIDNEADLDVPIEPYAYARRNRSFSMTQRLLSPNQLQTLVEYERRLHAISLERSDDNAKKSAIFNT